LSDADVIVVGSGINSLVCAVVLARSGLRVCILERNQTLGGCIRTEELTQPGFRHDTLSTLYPLFVSAPHYAELKGLLAKQGLRFVNTRTPTAVLRPDDSSLVFHTSREANVEELERCAAGDGEAYRRAMHSVEESAGLTFSLLGRELWTLSTARLLARHAWTMSLMSLSTYCGLSMQSCRNWLESHFRSDLARALIAPWVLHVGLGPESAASALMARLVMLTLEQFGSPMVAGGSANLVDAMIAIVERRGGNAHTGAHVSQVLIEDNIARGVRLADGRELRARLGVVCNVTPTQLYGQLVQAERVPPALAAKARAFRYGRGEMQIHLALDEPPQWPDDRLSRVAMLHVTPGLDAVSRAVNEAARGLLPAEATIVVAQPVALDPSRAPKGKSILWIQLQELPRAIRGDAASKLACPGDGAWNTDIRERYADRIIERLCRQIPNLRRSIVGRRVLSPADLESINLNLVGGDPYSGCCEMDQFLLWRPFPGSRNHETSIRRLYHIGASTHPGPGLGGMSGYLVAKHLTLSAQR
jgi:phytoene dehydrogenase-like protein